MNKKMIFKKYNLMKKIYKGNPEQVARLNRALGIAVSKNGLSRMHNEYGTTFCDCGCSDHKYRGQLWCKHILAETLVGGGQ